MKKLITILLLFQLTGCGAIIDTIALPFADKEEAVKQEESCECY